MEKTFEYTKRKLLRINKKKSKFICMSDEYDADTITITEDTNIGTIDPNEGYNCLGLWLIPTLHISKIIKFKMSNIAKCYAWLEINTDTPIILKIRVLYSCLFATIIYGCEAWGSNRKYADQLKKIETKTLKSCLGVKQGTSNDIIYQELNQPDIIATIKERQFNFYKKYSNLQEHECTSKAIWKLYETLVKHDSPGNIRKYYENLKDKFSNDDITERRYRIMNSQSTMAKTYANITNLVYSQLLYTAFNNERSRIILTKWRLSSHKLSVETGRYAVPTIPRERRLCIICFEIEDEHHALFICKAHLFIEDTRKIAKQVKDKMKENHLQAWKEKPRHGYLMRTREDLTQKNETASNAWMKRSTFSSLVEGYLCAIQEEEIFTNALKSRRVMNVEVDANCRRCRNSKETIQHVMAACPRLSASMYLPWRHNKVANIIYQNVIPKNDGNKRQPIRESFANTDGGIEKLRP